MNLSKVLALVATLALILALAVPSQSKHKSDSEKARAAVKITRLDERSGGTGVVLSSTATQSLILTNSHVCGVVENGGIVQNDYHRGFVTSYTRSAIHDLCLITTSTDFETETRVAERAADVNSMAAVSGYPRLNPNIITRGSFGTHMLVTIMTGIRPCSEEDLKSPDPTVSMICMFLGGFPVIRTYDAQFTGATIQAGNSGSAVYNESGELAGLVFAGSGDFGYGVIVPLEYIHNFLHGEIHSGQLETKKPNTEMVLDVSALTSGRAKFQKACRDLNNGNKDLAFLSNYCNMVSTDLIYDK